MVRSVRDTVMSDLLTCEIRYSEDETRESPGRLSGTLITYEVRAADRPEIFRRGALRWPESGVLVREMHVRDRPLVKVIPYLDGDAVKIDTPLPNTTRGRDASEGIRAGIYGGLSVEFHAEDEGRRGPLREIRRALLGGAGLVDSPAYSGSTVEVRAKRYWQLDREALRWL